MRIIKRVAVSIALTLPVMLAGSAAALASTGHGVHVVHPGQSIQAVLDKVHPGDTVLVKRGVYHEALEIDTDGVTLIGQGAVLEPPPTPKPLHCATDVGLPGDAFGLCVTGTFSPESPTTVLRPIKNVTIRGMIVHQFPSTGIVTAGADNVRIEDSEAIGGTEYGILLSQTTRGTLLRDKVSGGHEAAVYLGDSPNSHDVVRDSDISDSGTFGVFVRNSSHGTITDNKITKNCTGVAMLPTAPDLSEVSDWLVTRNQISDNDKNCADVEETEAPVGGVGVLLAGSSRTIVSANKITNNHPVKAELWSGGVVLVSAAAFGGPARPADNLVAGNVLRGNRAFDINVIDQGDRNHFVANRCGTSTPAGLCG
jgi:nitrous oxidase accessory protein NosD